MYKRRRVPSAVRNGEPAWFRRRRINRHHVLGQNGPTSVCRWISWTVCGGVHSGCWYYSESVRERENRTACAINGSSRQKTRSTTFPSTRGSHLLRGRPALAGPIARSEQHSPAYTRTAGRQRAVSTAASYAGQAARPGRVLVGLRASNVMKRGPRFWLTGTPLW